MKETEFDRIAEEYESLHAENIKASGETPEFFAKYKVVDVARQARKLCLEPSAILDFGGGIGNSIQHFKEHFPSSTLFCADVSRKSLKIAEGRFPNLARLHHIENETLSGIGAKFDVLFSACVFHHIPREQHEFWLRELRSNAARGALLAIFEHNPWNPLTVRAVNNCAFDANARLISAPRLVEAIKNAGWRDISVQYRIFFPAALKRLRVFEPMIVKLPLGAQYAVYARAQ